MNTTMTEKQDLSISVALLACAHAAFFTLTIIFAHVVANDIDHISTALSQYALHDYGFILGFGFYAVGATQLLLAYLLKNNNAEYYSLSAVFLAIAGIGVILVGAFPTQLPPASVVERLPHISGAVMQFLFFPLAALSLATNMKSGPHKIYTLLVGCFTGILFVVILVLFVTPSMRGFAYFGLIEKTNILAINFWLIYITYILYKDKVNVL